MLLLGLLAGLPTLAAPGGDDPIAELRAELEAELGPPGAPPATARGVDDRVRAISKRLRCPVCQNVSIQDSPVQSAQDMRARVREMVEAGYDRETIEGYFVDAYGESVLLSPPASGLNWLVWVVPALGGGLALAVLVGVVVRWRQEPDPLPLPSETGEAPLDRYEQQLLDEIEG